MNNQIDINDYDYNLPEERIAKYPLSRRDQSKMLIYDNGNVSDGVFHNLVEYLPTNAALFFNNTKVLYARLPFVKSTGAKIEVFCLEPHFPVDYSLNLISKSSCQWKCLVGNLKKWKTGVITLENNPQFELKAEIVSREPEHVVVDFSWSGDWSFAEILSEAGGVPIPPYLNRRAEAADKETYQTMYSRIEGSVAAPTAGLHFTPELMSGLKESSIPLHEVTLHVGAGTFRPVSCDDVSQHTMHQEFITVKREVIESLLSSKHIVYAVGTTTVRTLESLYWIGVKIWQKMPLSEVFFHVEQWEPYQTSILPSTKEVLEAVLRYMDTFAVDVISGKTSIIIVPGYKHKIVQGLITNFHQPRSTLLLLLASFIGDRWKDMYAHAIINEYRFLSYGDSCLIKHKGLLQS